jgi:adenine-specific DNA-methyltransferase
MNNGLDLNSLDLLDREDLLKLLKGMISGGVALSFHGKRTATEIARRVRPRVTRCLPHLGVGTPEEQSRNMIVEGENLQAMVTLYKYRGQIDLILTDPPYNTGNQFRYNDRWDEDPNDPDLGDIVPIEDGSRHTKWMKAMLARLHMMKAMLKPHGVIAICIDDNELFHLGMMMDEVFGEENRIAVINWQKTTVKNNTKRVSSTTEYVLVYAKDLEITKTGLLERSEKANARFGNPDTDPDGDWKQGDLTGTGADSHPTALYAIQSPFTGELHYPPQGRCWGYEKRRMKEWLEGWGSVYEERDLKDKCPKALALKGCPVPGEHKFDPEHAGLTKARKAAEAKLNNGHWPRLYFGHTGQSKPMSKQYLTEVKAGAVPTTFWVDEEDEPVELGSVSWSAPETGRSREGIEELDTIVGRGHGFLTVKPLKLIKKIIQIWAPRSGLVLDPYAGSGTVGHAVLELNKQTDSKRRFILIEQGRPENGDKYARTLTRERIKRAITGERAAQHTSKTKVSATPLGGGFEFRMLTGQIDAKVVLSMRKDELIDVVITSHWETNSRSSPSLVRIDEDKYKFLVGRNHKNEGYFLIWNGGNAVGSLNIENYNTVLQEGKKAGLKPPYHVYARYEVYQSQNVIFYKIPDKILAHLGLNESSDKYNEEE